MMRAAMGWGLLVWLSLSLPMSEAAPPDGASPVPKRATASELDEIQGALDKAEQDRAAMLRKVDDKSRQMAEEFKAIQKFLQKNAPWLTPDHKPEPDLQPVPDVLPPAPPPQSDALPTISIPEKVTGKKGQWIKIPATTNGGEVRWVSLTDGLSVFPTELLKSSATGIVSAIEDGEYRVLAYTALGNVPSDPVECLVVIGVGPRPPPVPPDPKPEPKPEPEPHPVAKKLYLVTIDEWQKRTPDIARVLGDDAYWKGLRAKGHDFRILDANGSGKQAAQDLADKIEVAGGFPVLVVADAETKATLAVVKLPKTTALIDEQVNKFTGGK